MLEVLKYIFSSGWIFVGVLILLYVIGETIGNIVIYICKAILGTTAMKCGVDVNLDLGGKCKENSNDR